MFSIERKYYANLINCETLEIVIKATLANSIAAAIIIMKAPFPPIPHLRPTHPFKLIF